MRACELDPATRGAVRVFHRSAPILGLADVLWTRSRGNPGLLGEILRDQQQRGRLVPHSAREPGWLLLCAPVHHHFQMSGWKETQVVGRFWLVAVTLAILALVSLKLR